MSAHLQHACLLRDRKRHDEAIAALHQHLAGEPDDFHGHYELAVTRLMQGEDHRAALTDVERAISLHPEAPHAHAIRSAILHALERYPEALAAADEAIHLDPEQPYAWFCRGSAMLGLRLLDEAEAAARKALELDPDHASASNLLSTVLRLQRRFGEAEVEIERHLARDPENAWTFATSGWTALHQGQRQKAEELFRESLRLDPGLEHARLGLREAYKARSAFYRAYLRWAFFLQSHSEKNRWWIVIGLYLAYRFGRVLLDAVHPLAAVPLVAAYLLLCFGTWLASGLGHFLLLTDRLARLSLNAGEKRDGLLTGGLFFAGLAVLIAGLTVLPIGFAFLGGAMMGAAVPGSMVFDNPSQKGRMVFGSLTVAVLACGALLCVFTSGKAPGEKLLDDRAGPLFVLGVAGIMATTWIGGIHALRNEAPR